MAGKVKRTVTMADGSKVSITVRPGASVEEMKRAAQTLTSGFGPSTDQTSGAKNPPKHQFSIGWNKPNTGLSALAPLAQPENEARWRRGLADQGDISAGPKPNTFERLGSGAEALAGRAGLSSGSARRLGSEVASTQTWNPLVYGYDLGQRLHENVASGDKLNVAGNLGEALLNVDPAVAKGGALLAKGAGVVAKPLMSALAPLAKTAGAKSILSALVGMKGMTAEELHALDIAKRMQHEGASDDEIWKATRMHFSPMDQKWRTEVSDTGFDVNMDAIKKLDPNTAAGVSGKPGWEGYVTHPELEKRYPNLSVPGMNPLRIGHLKAPPQAAGKYFPTEHGIFINPRLEQGGGDPHETMLHELGHGVQNIEGFAPGGGRVPGLRVQVGPYVDKWRNAKDTYIQSVYDQGWSPEKLAELKPDWHRKNLNYYDKNIRGAMEHEAYERIPGETEAVNFGETRLHMPEDVRAQVSPRLTMQYPYAQQRSPLFQNSIELGPEQYPFHPEDVPKSALSGPDISMSQKFEPPVTPPVPSTGKQAALPKVWEGVTNYGDALDIAKKGGHLRLDAKGNLMGSPDIKPGDLPDWRSNVDDLVARAQGRGLGWYQGGRDILSEVSDNPTMASNLARVGAVYSPQATPVSETGFALAHHNRRVLTGLEPQVTTGDRAKAANLGFGEADPATGYTPLRPEDIPLGEKTGPYAAGKDPTVPMGWTAPSDMWHGRALGYEGEGGKAFDRAFQPNEHAFIKGENALALDRAVQSGALPPGSSVANLQEVVWVQKRFEDFMAGKPHTPENLRDAEIYANQGIQQGIERHTAALSREFTPGGGLGEFPGISSDPTLNTRFSAEMQAAGGNPKNSVFSALQMHQRPTVGGQGFWNDPVEGMQFNPAQIDRPLVSFRPETFTNRKGVELTGGPAMDPESRQAMGAAGQLFGVENVQHGVGGNIFIPKVSTHKPDQLNGLYFGPQERQAAIDKATKAGLDVVDNGDGGIVVTSFADDMPGAAAKVKAFSQDAGGQLGRFDTNYIASNLPEEQGTGAATKSLLETTGTIPGFEQRLENSTYPAEVGARNEVRQRYASELATSLRPDVQKLRDLLAQGGPAAVRRWVDKNGLQGLPVWTGAILGGGALTAAALRPQPGQAQPGI